MKGIQKFKIYQIIAGLGQYKASSQGNMVKTA